MAIQLKPHQATKKNSRLKLGIVGPSGSGKTYSALAIAQGLMPDPRILVIDTERGSASKYADVFSFEVFELYDHSPVSYSECIQQAVEQGFDIIILDSLSSAWNGKNGALELVDNAAKRERGNSFGAWRHVTPLHNDMIDDIVGAKIHVIATMRAKTEYVTEKEGGKTTVRKIGTAPIQREGMEYEFDVVADMDLDNNLIVGKTRCSKLKGAVIKEPGASVGKILGEWLTDGVAEPEPVVEPAAPKPVKLATQEELTECETLRGQAVALGFRADDGSVPPVTKDGSSQKKANGRREIYRAFILEHGDKGASQVPAPQPAPAPDETPAVDAITNRVISQGDGYPRFLAAAGNAGFSWESASDFAAFEKAASEKVQMPVALEQMTDNDWSEFAAFVENGEFRWDA